MNAGLAAGASSIAAKKLLAQDTATALNGERDTRAVLRRQAVAAVGQGRKMRPSLLRQRLVVAALTLTGFAGLARAAEPAELDTLLARGQSQIQAGQPADAYALLASREAEFGGDASFDYLYGIAALDSGHAADAAFALGRVVAAEPAFDGARMELGRAYFDSGDYESAHVQFAYLRGRDPPPPARAALDRYLAAIASRDEATRPRLLVNFDLGSGYDSNANGSTADKQFLGFNLDARNVATSTSFVDAAVAANYVRPAGRAFGWIGDLGASQRWNPSAHFVDQSLLSAAMGLAARLGEWRSALGVGGYWAALDGAGHEWSGNVQARATHALGAHWAATGIVSYGALRYLSEQLKPLEVDRLLGSVRLDRASTPGGGTLTLTLLGGHDAAQRSSSPYGGDRYGARAGYSWQARAHLRAVVDAGALRSSFSGGAGFFGIARRDTQYSALVLLEIEDAPVPGWRLQPRLRYTKNQSNVSLYAYDRWEASLFLHRTFH